MTYREKELADADTCKLPDLMPGICERCRDYEYCHRQLRLDDMTEDKP